MSRLLLLPILGVLTLLPAASARPGNPTGAECSRTAGLELPEGFCASVFAEGLGRVREVTVSPAGDVYAAIRSGGAVVALRDADGDGRAEIRKEFGDDGGTGILWHDGWLWFGETDRILRWRLPTGQLEPAVAPEVIVTGLPSNGHSAKTLARLGGDTLIVNIGSETNSCQENDRAARSPGHDPCLELERRAGLWRFSASRTGQRQSDGTRYATGLRNAMALAVQPGTGQLYASPHGRDQLSSNWGFSDRQNAELPSEEFMRVQPGDDFGWPYCYYDWQTRTKVLAPEYGGDGREVGRCATRQAPLLGFPGHWAPMAIAFYSGTRFPPRYQGGAFVAFHGSWNRAPLPQAGYRVEFVPFAGGSPLGTHEVFATGSAGPTSLRAGGVAMGPDGSLYIAAENSGTIWKVQAR